MIIAESSPELNLAPNRFLKLILKSGNITLHLKRKDGIEMTYTLDTEGASFNEEVSDYATYQIVVTKPSDYDLELR